MGITRQSRHLSSKSRAFAPCGSHKLWGFCQNSVLDPILSRINGIQHWHAENENTGMYGRARY
jgi:hypothetical protein